MAEYRNQRYVLASRPEGTPVPDNFRLESEDVPALKDGQVLLEIKYLSLDPYMRGRMSSARSYAPPVDIDATMVGGTVAQVVESRHPDYSEGEWVLSYSGWQRYAISDGSDVRKLDQQVPVTTALGVLGMPGFTAYSGLLTIGQPRAGETVVVAAATGPVGSAVGQIAKLKGARAVGIAGGEEKCRLLTEHFGFDAAVDHRADDFAEQLAKACPDGVDVYFENVFGKVWEAVFPLFNTYARIPVCGLASLYNATGPFAEPDHLPVVMREVLSRSLTLRGFIQTEFAKEQSASFLRDMGEWVSAGKLKYLEDVVDGFEKAPEAFIGLLEGANLGKLIIKL
ncbi:NADP-dependent oxidoreductase [Carnimonas bestiolae]|uniref:NADP-dependent oxidoreductase n=1 Tax=Carnimonas bestiolae TaxID=3402172 RepID=UPI003EDBE264